jgi:hypothetical protein
VSESEPENTESTKTPPQPRPRPRPRPRATQRKSPSPLPPQNVPTSSSATRAAAFLEAQLLAADGLLEIYTWNSLARTILMEFPHPDRSRRLQTSILYSALNVQYKAMSLVCTCSLSTMTYSNFSSVLPPRQEPDTKPRLAIDH